MLVLTRRVSDQILVPSLGITVEVLSIKGNVVKLGINAPQEVRVLRGELNGTPPKTSQPEPTITPAQVKIEASKKKCTAQHDRSAQSRPLGNFVGKVDSKAASGNRTARTSLPKPMLYLSDDSSESVCETKSAYEVCT